MPIKHNWRQLQRKRVHNQAQDGPPSVWVVVVISLNTISRVQISQVSLAIDPMTSIIAQSPSVSVLYRFNSNIDIYI